RTFLGSCPVSPRIPSVPGPVRRQGAYVAGAAALAGIAAMVIAGLAGGALREQVIPGLGDAGTLTRWGLPVSRFVMEAGGTLTVGVLLGAAVLLPSARGMLDPQAVRYLRGASWIAAAWAAGAAATLIFTVSDILG